MKVTDDFTRDCATINVCPTRYHSPEAYKCTLSVLKIFCINFIGNCVIFFWLACWLMILCFNVGKWEAFISLTIGEIYTLKSWLVTKLSYNIWNFDVSAYAVFGGIEVLWKERKSRFKKYIYTHPTPINKILHRHRISRQNNTFLD